eukprot:CAMPEP_0177776054 /NCGR_PEP_ID=MMETSP0491_2-20121128/14478_1 /TAXON_ID=63592 /ORGANISM="Tetraselmis chuii, Strain PLY429" /LENGTH=233 /DNA_ID=CAMNT_0019294759 /DNA_START=206 /DNA_END=903 /DNA_ORIENTATION=+
MQQALLQAGLGPTLACKPRSCLSPPCDASNFGLSSLRFNKRTGNSRKELSAASLKRRSRYAVTEHPHRPSPRLQALPESQKTGGEQKQTRRLIMLRHAESEGRSGGVKDYARQVTAEGKKGAEHVAKQLVEQGWIPDCILCSPSMRTRQTLEAMTSAVEAFREVDVKFIESFYSVAALDGHTRAALESAISEEDATNSLQTVMCMGHNKGWEEAAGSFAGTTIKLDTSNAALL